MITSVEDYFRDGCGRCDLFATPSCKVNRWRAELLYVRKFLLSTNLAEEAKWGMPCYTYGGKNILLLSAFVNFCSINFFKGSLIQDPFNLLEKPGENSQASRIFKFQSVEHLENNIHALTEYVHQAIEIEKAGQKVKFKKPDEQPPPPELVEMMTASPEFEKAFKSLTPGRQRGYLLHFSQAKQSKTRQSRIEKCIPKIMSGKGFHDR